MSEREKIEIVGAGFVGTKWADEEDRLIKLKVNGDDVEVFISHPNRVLRGEVEPITVIWEGAIDFEGNRSEFVKRYPNLAKKLKEVI
ncbi:MAG: hypothetical protein DRN81_03655 [Thermoproteota archaeon]|nr:MAG: hypothetical protein DRN81_03655 [Candidatus Korarchaeota archaeon]